MSLGGIFVGDIRFVTLGIGYQIQTDLSPLKKIKLNKVNKINMIKIRRLLEGS